MQRDHLKFKKVPFNVFRGSDMDLPMRDHLTVRVQPNEASRSASTSSSRPGMHLGRAALDFDYDEAFAHTEISDAYELLILEAMRGDHSLFIRQDGVERAWEILSPCSSTRRRSASTSGGRGDRRRPRSDPAPKMARVGRPRADSMSRAYPISKEH